MTNPNDIDIDDLVTYDDLEDFEPELPDVPGEEDIEELVQREAERKTKAFLDHLVNEECDTESCQQIRDAFDLAGEDDDPDGEGADDPDGDGSGADPEPPEGDGGDTDPDDDPEDDPTPAEKYPNAAFPEELERL